MFIFSFLNDQKHQLLVIFIGNFLFTNCKKELDFRFSFINVQGRNLRLYRNRNGKEREFLENKELVTVLFCLLDYTIIPLYLLSKMTPFQDDFFSRCSYTRCSFTYLDFNLLVNSKHQITFKNHKLILLLLLIISYQPCIKCSILVVFISDEQCSARNVDWE